MERDVDDFCMYIASEKGLAQNTIEAYRHDSLVFVQFLHDRQRVKSFQQVDQADIVEFLGEMRAKNYASATICRALITIKVLFRFLKREGLVTTNIALYLETPKLWQLIPEVLDNDEVEKLLMEPQQNSFLGARDRAILEVLYGSGLRVSELCGLKIYDVDDTFIRVMGKGSKERLVPIGKKAIEAIDFFLGHYRCQFDSENLKEIFLTTTGRPIDRMAVWKMVKQRAKRAGITKNVSPHTLRHSFATHLLDNGADLRVIQEMMGHASINSTDRYMHISRSHLQEAFDAFSPKSKN